MISRCEFGIRILLFVLSAFVQFSPSTILAESAFEHSRAKQVSVRLNYEGEVFYGYRLNPSGKTRYRGLVDLYVSADTEKIGLWQDGEIFIKGQNGHGEGFAVAPAGVKIFLSDIDARSFTQISEYGLKQKFLDGRLEGRVGKQNANHLFAVNIHGENLIFPPYTLIPTVPMPTFPAPALGTSIWIRPTEDISARLGFYDGAPKIGGLGFDTFFEAKGGYFSIFEQVWTPDFGSRGGYKGKYALGSWYHSGQFEQTGTTDHPKTYSGDYGVYLLTDQWIYREKGEGRDEQGLAAFLQLGWAPSDRNQVTSYVGAGILYKGLLPGRNHDDFSIAASHTVLIGSAPTGGKEGLTNIECFYIFRFASWLALQPDVQYFTNTGLDHEDGFAAGLRWIAQAQ